jgi:hypothetical protein
MRPAAVACMVYRECGCAVGCAGTSIPRDELRVGLTVPIVAGMACGRTARVETAIGRDGHMVRVLESAERCMSRCGLTQLRPVDPDECVGQCDRCQN